MKRVSVVGLFLLLISFQSFTQEAWETHTRGLLHQSVFNTGALGVQYNAFRTLNTGDSLRTPFEWPGNSYFRYLTTDYWYYNSTGGGLAMLCDTGITGSRASDFIVDTVVGAAGIDLIGCLGWGSNGGYRDGTGIHYRPGTVTKATNYPLNADGSWNASYDPKEAEEIITSSVYTPYGIKITRTSRAWSYPGYDSFIIYDYEFKNTGEYFKNTTGAVSPTHATDTLSNIGVDWVESFLPSYFYANSVIGDFTSGASKELARFDLRRYMTYVHSPDGRPNATNYAAWSADGTNGGGLMAPATVGYMFLYYDYDHLMTSSTSRFTNSVKTALYEQLYAYDANNKFKQPWVVASTQTNLAPTKILSHVDGAVSRYNIWNPLNEATSHDSLELNTHTFNANFAKYWYGRAHPNANFNMAAPMVHSMALGPYILPPDESFHVVVAEVAGFGPGRKWDAQTYDYGGGNETTLIFDMMHPVPSWDSVITYPSNGATNTNNTPTSISSTGGVGIAYTPTYGIPSYIRDTTVVSIRDVADRCIQMYTGNTNVIKYDTTQYEPWGNTVATSNGVTANAYALSPSAIASRTGGWSAGINVPLPAPAFTVSNIGMSSGDYIKLHLSWSSAVDSVPTSLRLYITSGLKNYQVLRSTSKLGPWSTLKTISKSDAQYYSASTKTYSYTDSTSILGTTYYYAVVTVDSLNKKSGLTNIQQYKELVANVENNDGNHPYSYALNQNYPNPFNPTTQISYSLAKRGNVSLVIYDILGQVVRTLVNDVKEAGSYTVPLNAAKLSSGVYFYRLQSDSFVQTKKMVLLK
jgi:hypothetical protein